MEGPQQSQQPASHDEETLRRLSEVHRLIDVMGDLGVPFHVLYSDAPNHEWTQVLSPHDDGQPSMIRDSVRLIDYAISLDASDYWHELIMSTDPKEMDRDMQMMLGLQLLNSSLHALAQWQSPTCSLHDKQTLQTRALSAMRAISSTMRDDAEREFAYWWGRIAFDAEADIESRAQDPEG